VNVSKAVELAFASLLRDHAQLGKGVTIRAWQSLRTDGSWSPAVDRAFPLVDVRCSPFMLDPNETTLKVEVALLCSTKVDDDKDHAFVSAMYEELARVCSLLFSQFKTTTGEELAALLASIQANVDAGQFQFGGLSFSAPVAPKDEDGVNTIGITMSVHYGRSDF